MPVQNIRPTTKQSYVTRWFDDKNKINKGERFFFETPHTIANAGIWYLQNKYRELLALIRVLSIISNGSGVLDLVSTKRRIADVCYSAIYEDGARQGRFAVSKVCDIHSVLMHLSNPEKFESIVSENHKRRIASVFEHVISGHRDITCREERICLIRKRLYDEYGDEDDPDRKRRWFFYQENVKPLWIDKKGVSQQSNASVVDEVARELSALDCSEDVNLHPKGATHLRPNGATSTCSFCPQTS